MDTTFITNIQDALTELGVTDATLSNEEKQQLDADGYLVFPSLIGSDWLEPLRNAYEILMQQAAALQPHGMESGTRRLFDLENQGEVFDGVYTLPKVLAAAHHILGRDFRFVTLNGRDAIPGEGHQGLHMDWGLDTRVPAAVTCVVMLDDFTVDNGATRVVPGTHRLGIHPPPEMADPAHPEEVLVTGPAGSVIVFNSYLWHGGTQNRTSGTRRALHPYYMGREMPQSPGHLDARSYIRVKTYKRLSPAARYLMNVNWDTL